MADSHLHTSIGAPLMSTPTHRSDADSSARERLNQLAATPDPRTPPVLSVVVPMFNEDESLPAFLDVLLSVLKTLPVSFEVILVNDGSSDATWAGIEAAHLRDGRISGVSLARNFGHQNALMAGLQAASGAAVVTLDGDLQHPPEFISDLLREWKAGYKIVNTIRLDSTEVTLFKRATSRWFYRIFSLLSGIPMLEGSSDFRLIDRAVVNVIIQMRDNQLFLRGFVQWSGFPTTSLPFRANPRHAGRTKYSLVKMLRFSLAAMVSFSSLPLRIGVWIGLFTSFLALVEVCYIIVVYLQGRTVPGWASVLAVMSFMFGVLFFLLGIIGTYLSSIHETLKNRPHYVIGTTVGLPWSR